MIAMVTSQKALLDVLLQTITSDNPELRNRSLSSLCADKSGSQLLEIAEGLDRFARNSDNLYHQVRALFFLNAIYRFELPKLLNERTVCHLPYHVYEQILQRHSNEAIDALLAIQNQAGPSLLISSALAKAYHQFAFQRLADQVRRSVRTVRGNQWMFRIGHPSDYPLRLDRRMLPAEASPNVFPILAEQTSVRMDFTHSGWSDIFFLGMDFPEGAKVINASINLAVHGRDEEPMPPVQAFVRVIDRPVLRLVSVDLQAETELTQIDDVFDFAKDYLGLLKAAVIAAGIVPPAMEGCHRSMAELLQQLIGRPNLGLEIVSHVNNIPKGSRLAVSTNLLGSLIAALMRITNQVDAFTGPLTSQDQRLITARAILGEWMGGSGGGWQDSGGIWPGIKLITGSIAQSQDSEFGVSRGRLLPTHTILDDAKISQSARRKLEQSLILIYGGMAQNVGPILEMVTEKYLLRSDIEWAARQKAIGLLDQILDALAQGDIKRVGKLTTENFTDALQSIIPWCTNAYTNKLIELCREKFSEQFWGFWMLGGMSGGGMGFLFDPEIRPQAQSWLATTLVQTKRSMEQQLPFAMDPVVYDFSINDNGTMAELKTGSSANMPRGYYSITMPRWLRSDIRTLTSQMQQEWLAVSSSVRNDDQAAQWMLDCILPTHDPKQSTTDNLQTLLKANGFDLQAHRELQQSILGGSIDIAANRLPAQTKIEDVPAAAVVELRGEIADPHWRKLGQQAILDGQIAVMTLAAGVGSRWTGGAGVVKGLHPFCQFAGLHRSFIELHLAKTRRVAKQYSVNLPHIFSTGYLTHKPIENHLQQTNNYNYFGPVYLSKGMSVGLRTIPTPRDLQFLWEQMPQQVLDEQQQKVRASAQAALMQWAADAGPASDYTDNVPMQCMHPVGHWYEIPNLLLNGTLHKMLTEQPQVTTILLHNIDTLGASIDPVICGRHIAGEAALSFEVIARRIDDRGGGLAMVDGKPRLVEGLAMPNESDEFKLTYYNSMTTWINIDRLLVGFNLKRKDLNDTAKVRHAVRTMAARLPTYITIKDVKKRWGHAQEDVYPVSQFEKLWGDMSALPDIDCEYFAVPFQRGQQLKDVAQLDGWVRDGSANYIDSLCHWE